MLRNPWSSAPASIECIYAYAYAYLSMIPRISRKTQGKDHTYTQENAATIKNNHPTQNNSRPCTHKTQSPLHMPRTPRPLKNPDNNSKPTKSEGNPSRVVSGSGGVRGGEAAKWSTKRKNGLGKTACGQ